MSLLFYSKLNIFVFIIFSLIILKNEYISEIIYIIALFYLF
jgi:hypothetical protein